MSSERIGKLARGHSARVDLAFAESVTLQGIDDGASRG